LVLAAERVPPTEYVQRWVSFWFDAALRLEAAKAFERDEASARPCLPEAPLGAHRLFSRMLSDEHVAERLCRQDTLSPTSKLAPRCGS